MVNPPQRAERSSAQRRLQNRVDARRAILEATQSLLVSGGHEGFSMRRLADRCGYTAPTIYHYFGDKQGLIDTLLEERFRRLVVLLRKVPAHADAVEVLRALALAFARFGLENPTHYRLLSLARDPDLEPLPSAEEARALLAGPLERIAAEGRLRNGDVDLAGQAFWSLLHGLITLRTSRPDYCWAEGLLETALDALIRGLVQSSEPSGGEPAP